LSTIDIIIAIILIFGGYRGFRKGLAREIISLVAFILAIVLGLKLMPYGESLLSGFLSVGENLLSILAFIIIFLSVVFTVNLLGVIVKRALDLTPLGGIDSIAGSFLGFFKWAFFLSLFFWLLSAIGLEFLLNLGEDSVFYPYISGLAPKVLSFFSDFSPYLRDLLESVNESEEVKV